MNICEHCNKEHDGSFGSGRFCSKTCANTQIHSQATKNKISNSVKNSEFFKEEMFKRKVDIIKKQCPMCNNFFKGRPSDIKNKIYCSSTCCFLDRTQGYKFAKKPTGGYRPGGGRGKKGWYKNFFCDSTYELVFVIYCIDHNISFTRNTTGFPYFLNDKLHHYYPDFIISDEYIEVKGYETNEDLEKYKQFPYKLKVLKKEDLKSYFEYVYTTYTKNLINLYEPKQLAGRA